MRSIELGLAAIELGLAAIELCACRPQLLYEAGALAVEALSLGGEALALVAEALALVSEDLELLTQDERLRPELPRQHGLRGEVLAQQDGLAFGGNTACTQALGSLEQVIDFQPQRSGTLFSSVQAIDRLKHWPRTVGARLSGAAGIGSQADVVSRFPCGHRSLGLVG